MNFLHRDLPQIIGFSVWIPGVLLGARIAYGISTKGAEQTRDFSAWNWEEIGQALFVGLWWPLLLVAYLVGLIVAWRPEGGKRAQSKAEAAEGGVSDRP